METQKRTIKFYLWSIRLVSVLAGAVLGWTVYSVSPDQGVLWRVTFYASMFFFLAGCFVLMLNRVRTGGEVSSGDEAAFKFRTSFHQGVLLALLIVLLLFMQSLRMLVWWDGLMVVAGILLLELYFLTK